VARSPLPGGHSGTSVTSTGSGNAIPLQALYAQPPMVYYAASPYAVIVPVNSGGVVRPAPGMSFGSVSTHNKIAGGGSGGSLGSGGGTEFEFLSTDNKKEDCFSFVQDEIKIKSAAAVKSVQ
jgi:hypothetical protein